MFAADFLSNFDRLVSFDAETTGKRAIGADFVRRQAKGWKAPGIIIELGFVEMLRDGEGWRRGATWRQLVDPCGPIDPIAIKIHGIKPRDLAGKPKFAELASRVMEFIGDSPIVAHAYRNERGFLDCEMARAGRIAWGESAFPNERYICTQQLYAQVFPGAPKSLTAMSDRLALDASGRDQTHGALLDAELTADALVELERILKHGHDSAPRSWQFS